MKFVSNCCSFIDTINTAIAVKHDNTEDKQFYLPLTSVSINYQKNSNQTCQLLQFVVGYRFQISDNLKDCLKYGMFRKLLAMLNTNEFHLVTLDKIEYSLWMPHACYIKDSRNASNKSACTCEDYILKHNYQYNKAFFFGCFARKWLALNYRLKFCPAQEDLPVIESKLTLDDIVKDSSDEDSESSEQEDIDLSDCKENTAQDTESSEQEDIDLDV